MLLTILKIVAGLAVLGIIGLVSVAVFSGLMSATTALRNRGNGRDTRPTGDR